MPALRFIVSKSGTKLQNKFDIRKKKSAETLFFPITLSHLSLAFNFRALVSELEFTVAEFDNHRLA